jgi:hypothetical protein
MAFDADERAVLDAARRIKARGRKEAKAARPKSPKADRGRERNNGFLAYLRRQRCEAWTLGNCHGSSDPAHIRFNDGPDRQNPGGARKNHDRHCNPLCRAHHDLQHSMNERAFWERLGKDAYATAAGHFAAYQGQAAGGEAGAVGMEPQSGGMNQKDGADQ